MIQKLIGIDKKLKNMNYEKAVANIRKELKKYVQNNDIKSLVIGISGGMDSCLCAALARPVCDELNIPLIGVSLPSESNDEDEISRAEMTLDIFCHKTDTYYIDELYHRFSEINKLQFIPEINDCGKSDGETYLELLKLGEDTHNKIMKNWKIRAGNIKARIRMIYLYNLASMYNGIVLSTDNYTEYLLGFWTLHGDVGDFGMIQNLYKSEVYDMAEWIATNECKFLDKKIIIASTMDALATDGLGVTNRGDLGQILPEWNGTSREGYKVVDTILQIIENVSARDPHHEIDDHPIVQRYLKTEFKRRLPINIKREKLL
jgi:NH3-dependent NAD+ synthetase